MGFPRTMTKILVNLYTEVSLKVPSPLNTRFDFQTFSGQICPFSLDDFSLMTGPKITTFIHLGRRSYSILKYIKNVIVGPEITTKRDLPLAANVSCSYII